ncbi:uncharacterized protein LOC125230361 [Leguminivora glycinivorella]|uniref:uncharacterized protein LOC125230361 n=1 Tax=Leguminivora glycinivorella TaxID=1035111 RepID=UPI002010A7F1|nr:uncharacterized protein LOC125230361 [Leguminivora glycinivorella]
MPSKVVRVTKFLLAAVTVFFFSWMVCVNEWHNGVAWGGRRGRSAASTMRTIVAYSEDKQAEMDRPSPVTCDRLPAFPDIPYINRTWSRNSKENTWQKVEGTGVSLYAAFYDQRAAQPYVRILASFQGRNILTELPLFCQTRSLNSEESVEVVAAKPLEIWWHEWDSTTSEIETPLLLSCPLTEALNGPSTVSIVTQPCDDPTNAFALKSYSRDMNYKRTFTICVKDMKFENDVSQNLVEWIETNKILGVDMIDMYIDSITKECENILFYYRDLGYVRLFQVPIKHKLERSLWQRRRDHIITYNDCLYRNIRESEYIIPLDVDEIVLPKEVLTWPELLSRLSIRGWDPSQYSAIMIQNAFFFDFMQGLNKYKAKKLSYNNSKIYIKRDDVRIKDAEYLEEIELIDYENRIDNEVIDIKDTDKELYDMYKEKCGKELVVPKLVRHIVRSAVISPKGSYSKSFMLTRKVLTAFNHYPLASLGSAGFLGWSAPFSEVQLNHYKESCNTTVVAECARYGRRARVDTAALRLGELLTRALTRHCPPQ